MDATSAKLLGSEDLVSLRFSTYEASVLGDAVSFLTELWLFLRVRKKLWLLPIILTLLTLGGLLILAEGSVLAPFIYTLF